MYVVDIDTLQPMTYEQAQARENSERTGLILGFSEPGLEGTRYAMLDTGDMPLVDSRYFKLELSEVDLTEGVYTAQWLTVVCDAPVESIAAEKLADMQSACSAAIEEGFYSSALGDQYRYSSDRDSQTNMQWNLFAAMAGEDVSHICYNSEGERVEMVHTPAQMTQVSRDFGGHIWPKLRKYSDLRAAIEAAADDKEALVLITW